MTPETVVCWRWKPPAGYRSSFGPDTVRVLRNMVARNFDKPHRFVCVTDSPEDIDSDIETIHDWGDFKELQSPHGGRNPSCYRRLRLFHPDAEQWFGKRFVSLDLDCVITGDLLSLWSRPEPFVAWGDTNTLPGSHYNGSMMMLTAGARPQVWNDFNPESSPRLSRQARCWGSDQGWISYVLGKGEAKWTRKDGVYSFRNEIQRLGMQLPENAKVVVFHGMHDPWSPFVQSQYPWVREQWR